MSKDAEKGTVAAKRPTTDAENAKLEKDAEKRRPDDAAYQTQGTVQKEPKPEEMHPDAKISPVPIQQNPNAASTNVGEPLADQNEIEDDV